MYAETAPPFLPGGHRSIPAPKQIMPWFKQRRSARGLQLNAGTRGLYPGFCLPPGDSCFPRHVSHDTASYFKRQELMPGAEDPLAELRELAMELPGII